MEVAESFGSLVVIKKNGKDGHRQTLECDSYSIGRHPDCDIVLNIDSVSRFHCKLFVDENGTAWIKNDSTSQGVIVNDKEIKNIIALKNGDIIGIATRSFRFETVSNPRKAIPKALKSPKSAQKVYNRTPLSAHNYQDDLTFSNTLDMQKALSFDVTKVYSSDEMAELIKSPAAKSVAAPSMEAVEAVIESAMKEQPAMEEEKKAMVEEVPMQAVAAPSPIAASVAPVLQASVPENFLSEIMSGRSKLRKVTRKSLDSKRKSEPMPQEEAIIVTAAMPQQASKKTEPSVFKTIDTPIRESFKSKLAGIFASAPQQDKEMAAPVAPVSASIVSAAAAAPKSLPASLKSQIQSKRRVSAVSAAPKKEEESAIASPVPEAQKKEEEPVMAMAEEQKEVEAPASASSSAAVLKSASPIAIRIAATNSAIRRKNATKDMKNKKLKNMKVRISKKPLADEQGEQVAEEQQEQQSVKKSKKVRRSASQRHEEKAQSALENASIEIIEEEQTQVDEEVTIVDRRRKSVTFAHCLTEIFHISPRQSLAAPVSGDSTVSENGSSSSSSSRNNGMSDEQMMIALSAQISAAISSGDLNVMSSPSASSVASSSMPSSASSTMIGRLSSSSGRFSTPSKPHSRLSSADLMMEDESAQNTPTIAVSAPVEDQQQEEDTIPVAVLEFGSPIAVLEESMIEKEIAQEEEQETQEMLTVISMPAQSPAPLASRLSFSGAFSAPAAVAMTPATPAGLGAMAPPCTPAVDMNDESARALFTATPIREKLAPFAAASSPASAPAVVVSAPASTPSSSSRKSISKATPLSVLASPKHVTPKFTPKPAASASASAAPFNSPRVVPTSVSKNFSASATKRRSISSSSTPSAAAAAVIAAPTPKSESVSQASFTPAPLDASMVFGDMFRTPATTPGLPKIIGVAEVEAQPVAVSLEQQLEMAAVQVEQVKPAMEQESAAKVEEVEEHGVKRKRALNAALVVTPTSRPRDAKRQRAGPSGKTPAIYNKTASCIEEAQMEAEQLAMELNETIVHDEDQDWEDVEEQAEEQVQVQEASAVVEEVQQKQEEPVAPVAPIAFPTFTFAGFNLAPQPEAQPNLSFLSFNSAFNFTPTFMQPAASVVAPLSVEPAVTVVAEQPKEESVPMMEESKPVEEPVLAVAEPAAVESVVEKKTTTTARRGGRRAAAAPKKEEFTSATAAGLAEFAQMQAKQAEAEAPMPARSTRGRKAAAAPTAPATVVEAPVVVAQPEAVVEAVAAPSRATRGRKAAASVAVQEPKQESTPVTVVAEAPAARSTRGRKAAAPTVVEAPAVVEEAIAEPVKEQPAKRTRGGAAKKTAAVAVVEAPVAVEEAEEKKQEEAAVPAKRARRGAAPVAMQQPEPVIAAPSVPEAAVEEAVVAPRATRGRKAVAAVVAAPAPVPVVEEAPVARSTRSSRNTKKEVAEAVEEESSAPRRSTRARK